MQLPGLGELLERGMVSSYPLFRSRHCLANNDNENDIIRLGGNVICDGI